MFWEYQLYSTEEEDPWEKLVLEVSQMLLFCDDDQVDRDDAQGPEKKNEQPPGPPREINIRLAEARERLHSGHQVGEEGPEREKLRFSQS